MVGGFILNRVRGYLLDNSKSNYIKTDKVKILIGCPCYSGRVVVETVSSMVQAIRYHSILFPRHLLNLRFRVRNFTTYAAEKLCEEACEGYDYLLFWGDDMLPPIDCISRLLIHNKDIVASMVFARSEPFAIDRKSVV